MSQKSSTEQLAPPSSWLPASQLRRRRLLVVPAADTARDRPSCLATDLTLPPCRFGSDESIRLALYGWNIAVPISGLPSPPRSIRPLRAAQHRVGAVAPTISTAAAAPSSLPA
uniref:Uncharacterized protein n=1 Tax=Leersia perrieri TaxID=77586 RepID=A0A0D9XI58_9ORYZ